MKYCNYIFCSIILCIIIISCEETEFTNHSSKIVIDGYIDEGGFPIVMITTSVPISTTPIKVNDLENHLLRWAKVSINDGENEVILTGKYDSSYFPPYVYTSGHLRGEQGKTYTLKVEYDNYFATASTTIPSPPQIDSIKIEPTSVDSLCKIILCFTDDCNELNYYKTFVRKGKDSRQWKSSYLGIISDEVLGKNNELIVNQGSFLTDTIDFSPFFNYNDTISIKFAEIDKIAYHYWNDYENYTSFSRNPLFPMTQNLHSNILGGFGCWYGCGAKFIHIPLINYKNRQNTTIHYKQKRE